MNLKLWPGLIVGILLFGGGMLTAWAIWGREAPKIPSQVVIKTVQPSEPDSNEMKVKRLEGELKSLKTKKIANSERATDSLEAALKLARLQAEVTAKTNKIYRERADSLLREKGLSGVFKSNPDTSVPHTIDVVTYNLVKDTFTFEHSGLVPTVIPVENGRISHAGGAVGWLLLEGVVWGRGGPEALLSVKSPYRPVWWFPNRVGGAARANGAKGLVFGWSIF